MKATEKTLRKAFKENIEWFMNSGVMSPNDGSWGVAERIAVTDGNEAIDKMFKSFPAYIVHDGYAVIEQRRPDCNFEAALMFFTAAEVFGDKKFSDIAENILIYLYSRSGMRNRDTRRADYAKESWRWSNIGWTIAVYFDDNAWNCVIPLIIAKKRPDLDKKFEMRSSALILASEMEAAFTAHFSGAEEEKKKYLWAGDVKSPHWGSLAVMTFGFAYAETHDEKYKSAALAYNKYLLKSKDSFTSSEIAYILIGNSIAAQAGCGKELEESAKMFGDILISKIDTRSNIPSEWDKEAPAGKHLVDLIYTQNWSLLGLKELYSMTGEKKHKDACQKVLSLILEIQDKSPEKQFKGCWRGMYDLSAGKWGGGDRYEGGAGSIYTGWTNAPISMVIAAEILKTGGIFPQ
jgi:hypothetical protein